MLNPGPRSFHRDSRTEVPFQRVQKYVPASLSSEEVPRNVSVENTTGPIKSQDARQNKLLRSAWDNEDRPWWTQPAIRGRTRSLADSKRAKARTRSKQVLRRQNRRSPRCHWRQMVGVQLQPGFHCKCQATARKTSQRFEGKSFRGTDRGTIFLFRVSPYRRHLPFRPG